MENDTRSVAIAMDGPLGPRHIPKKLIYFLSEKSNARLTGVTLSYSRKISLRNRWDHYRIPLPFSRITVRFDDYDVASCQKAPRIRVYQKESECSIMAAGVLE